MFIGKNLSNAPLERIDLLKLVIGAIIGSMFAISVYNAQTGGSIFTIAIVAVVALGIALAIFFIPYRSLLKELENM